MKNITYKYLFIILGAILLLLLFYFYSPYEYAFFPQCPTYKYLGLHCGGCGLQRSIFHLVHGEWFLLLRSNLFLPVWFVLFMNYIYNQYKNTVQNAWLMQNKVLITIIILLIIYSIIRNLPYHPFTYLAPVL